MLAGACELAAQRSVDTWSIKAHSETAARQQALVAHYTTVSQPALPEVRTELSAWRWVYNATLHDGLCHGQLSLGAIVMASGAR